jgi:hypothetical protein
MLKEDGSDDLPPLILAQNDMISNEVTYFYYRFLYEVMIMLIFVAICGIIVEKMDENDLRTLWSGICSWYAQTVAWGQLQTETIYQSISR